VFVVHNQLFTTKILKYQLRNRSIEPEFVFSNTKVLVEKYDINIKGIKYVENILQNDLYYDLKNHSKNKYVKSKRSYYLEKQIIKC
jgi:hypothetical protein